MEEFKKNWFLLGLLLVLLISFTLPELGLSINGRGGSAYLLVFLLFLITGFNLPGKRRTKGAAKILVHVYIQGFIFLLTPLYFYLTARLLFSESEFMVGIIALAALPTTVSSCIVFTQISGGNTAVSLFNSGFSNFTGIFLSPLLLSIMLSGPAFEMPLDAQLKLVSNLGMFMLLPVIIGFGAKRLAVDNAPAINPRLNKALNVMANLFILLIILFSFSKIAVNPSFREYLAEAYPLAAYLAISHCLIVALVWSGGGFLGFNFADRVAALFTAPQKTLAFGAPMLTIYFDGDAHLLSLALLPVVFYHIWQLLIAGVLKNSLSRHSINPAIK